MRLGLSLGLLAFLGTGLCAGEDAPADVYSIPRLDNIVVDGKVEDWEDKGFKVDVLADPAGNVQEAADYLPSFRLGWNDKGLVVLVTVRDDTPLEPATKPEELWKGDSIEFFVADKKGGENSYQVVIAPGVDPKNTEVRGNLSDYRKSEELKKNKLKITFFRTKNDDGYVLEVLLPWENLGGAAADGREVGFQIYANDSDEADQRYQAMWYPLPDAHSHSDRVQRLKLSSEASRPVQAAANVEVGADGKVIVKINGTAALDGEKIQIKAGDKTVGKGKLTAQGVRATAKIELKPKENEPLGPLTVLIDNKPLTTLEVPKK